MDQPYPAADVYVFTVRLVESLGVRLDHDAMRRRVIEIARGELTLLGSLEEEIAAAPELEAHLRAMHARPDARHFMQVADRQIAQQVAAGMAAAQSE